MKRTNLALALLILATCSVSQPTNTTTAFDGVYAGTTQVTFNKLHLCLPTDRRLTIAGGRFEMPTTDPKLGPYVGVVSADGNFATVINTPFTSYLKGTVDGTNALVTISNPGCEWKFNLTKTD